jgi:hypothetical protein
MASCQNCGNPMPDTAAVCPNCGQSISAPPPMPQRSSYDSGYMAPQPDYMAPQPPYMPPQQQYMQPQQGYMAPQQQYMPPQPGYMAPQPQYMPPPQQAIIQQSSVVNVSVGDSGSSSQGKTGLIVEIILNLFGIYGVGWLIAGETTVGIVLLICSFVVFWPTVVLLAVLTVGFGLFCDFPLGIGLLILNAILLNNAINRKATQRITVVQTQARM